LRVLVTGATGYIGSKLAGRLKSEGFDVYCLVRKDVGSDDFNAVPGDLLRPSTLRDACRGIDVVCNCAGAHGKWSIPKTLIESVNVEGPKNLLRAAMDASASYMLHLGAAISIGLELGDGRTKRHLHTFYARTKYKGVVEALKLARELDMPFGVVHPTFTYGPGDPHKLKFIKTIKKGYFFHLKEGSTRINPVYIDDLIDGIALALQKRPNQEAYILGGPRPVTYREWAETIAKALNVSPPRFSIPLGLAWLAAIGMESVGRIIGKEPPLTRSRVLTISQDRGWRIDKARRELGYDPSVDIAEGIQKTIEWYKENGKL
jgi:nucleoside-diphosphate-sugar epimerase